GLVGDRAGIARPHLAPDRIRGGDTTHHEQVGDTLTLNSANTADQDYASGQVMVHGKFLLGPLSNQLTAGIAGEGTNNKSAQASLPLLPSNLYFPRDYPNLTPSLANSRLQLRARSYSVLLSDIIGWGEQWSVLLGGRYIDVNQDNYSLVTGAITTSNSDSKVAPALALMFKPVPEALIYGSYVEGLEAGVNAPAGTANANQALPPAVTEQYEIGAKWQLKDLLFTLAAFDMTRPLNFVDPLTNRFVQNGEQRHKGVEFLASGRVTPDLNLVGGVMYINPENVATGNPLTSGKEPPGVPQVTANLYGEYRIGAVPGLFLTGGIYYAAKQFANATNTASIPSWTRFDVGARYETFAFGKPAAILFAVENVANRSYWANAQASFLTLGLPLTVKLTARLSF
ncbi:MAG: TonB-dependent receptor, partial [Vicinamibacterales bacterium]